MEKRMIDVEICFGTTCYVLGGSRLQELENYMDDDMKSKTNIIPRNCLGLCRNSNFKSAPFVKVNGKIFDEASPEEILTVIRREIDESN